MKHNSWLPNTTYFDEQANRTDDLVELELPELSLPSADDSVLQREFIRHIHCKRGIQENRSDYSILIRNPYDNWKYQNHFEDIGADYPGNLAIVLSQ